MAILEQICKSVNTVENGELQNLFSPFLTLDFLETRRADTSLSDQNF